MSVVRVWCVCMCRGVVVCVVCRVCVECVVVCVCVWLCVECVWCVRVCVVVCGVCALCVTCGFVACVYAYALVCVLQCSSSSPSVKLQPSLAGLRGSSAFC